MTMVVPPFEISRLPRIVFGSGSFARLPSLIEHYGRTVLLVMGEKTFRQSDNWIALARALDEMNVTFYDIGVAGEPSPRLVDEAVARYKESGIDVVVGIGGGSALDAGKAIAGLLPHGNSAMDHLEGVGRDIPYNGPATPYIAVPTTAGTGSEATKNAVLGVQGPGGFKKSFRHEALVPEYALVDPELLATCPADLVAANGMDALTQLLESYVSLKANPMVDALALSGIEAVKQGLFAAWEGGDSERAAGGRTCMAYAALLSGITLAQVGLGSVHGLASPLGAYFPIGHGVVCGTLLAAATEVNIRVLEERMPGSPALGKYAHLGRLLSGRAVLNDAAARTILVDILAEWVERLGIPRLSQLGVGEADFARIVANSRGSSMKTNPISLTDEEIADILRKRT